MPTSKTQEQKGDGSENALLTRVTVNLVPRAMREVNDIHSRTGYNRTDIINRSIQVYAILEKELDAGARVFVDRGDGPVELKIIL